MNCESCREAAVAGLWGDQVELHAAECDACRAWLEQENAIMKTLASAGRTWRNGPVRAENLASGAERPRRSSGLVVRLATAAAVLLLSAGGVYMATKPSAANAMAVMGERLRQAGTMRFQLSMPHEGMTTGMFYVSGDKIRVEMSNGEVLVMDGGRQEGVLLRPARREVIRGAKPSGAVNFYDMFVSLADAPRVEDIGPAEIDGRYAETFRAQIRHEAIGGADLTATVWLDPDTRLPLRVEIPTVGKDGAPAQVVFSQFGFDEAFDLGMFDTVAAGFTEVRPQATTPGIGIELARKMRSIGMALQLYMHEHDGRVPDSLADLTQYLPEGGLRSARQPGEAIGYEYVKPTLPLNFDAVLAYERFAGPEESVWVLLIDGSVHLKTRAELRAMLGQ